MTSFLQKVVRKIDDLILSSAGRFYGIPLIRRIVAGQFHRLLYTSDKDTWFGNTFWLGVEVLKNPMDMWVYQEIFYDVKPDLVIECGTYFGGSTLYFASLLDLLGNGKILSIDIEERPNLPKHDRIHYLTGSSVDSNTLSKVRDAVSASSVVLVVLDSDHSKAHVLEELNLYCEFVTPGSYIVVEDSNVNGHPVRPLYGAGPMEAIHAFMTGNDSFVIDKERE